MRENIWSLQYWSNGWFNSSNWNLSVFLTKVNVYVDFDYGWGDSEKSHRETVVQSSYQRSIAPLKLNPNKIFTSIISTFTIYIFDRKVEDRDILLHGKSDLIHHLLRTLRKWYRKVCHTLYRMVYKDILTNKAILSYI